MTVTRIQHDAATADRPVREVGATDGLSARVRPSAHWRARRQWHAVQWGAACAIVLGSSLALVRCLAPAPAEGVSDASVVLYWAALALIAVGTACPWLALARVRAGTAWSRWGTLASGVLGYGGAGVLSVLHLRSGAPSRAALLGCLAAVLGVQAIALALRARQRRFAAALVIALLALGLAAWAPWATESGWAVREGWMMLLASPLLAAMVLSVVVFVTVGAPLWVCRVQRRRVWAGAAALALASSPAWWMGMRVLGRGALGALAEPRLVRRGADLPADWSAADPAGPFKAAGEAVLGWRWANVGRGTCFRDALLLQPPCRVKGRTVVPAGGILRLFLALPRTGTGTPRQAVLVRCMARDTAGREVAAASRVLRSDDAANRLGQWSEWDLDVSGPAGSSVDLTLEAGAEEPGGPAAGLPMLAVAAPPVAAVASPGPNCVIILVDALRADRLHCYGFPLATSPHIDELATQGTLFEHVTSACSWTVPSVASLFTGTYVSTHGMDQFCMPGRLSLPTLAEQFRQAGARTAAVSANECIIPGAGYEAGFDEFVFKFDFPRAGWVTDEAVALLRRLSGQRFFLYLHYMDPHEKYDPPPGWTVFGYTEEQRYHGEIRYCDHEIGRLLRELDTLGRREDTLVVFIADHGEAFMEHGYRFHAMTLHREEVQVPLILRLPERIPAERRVTTRVRSIDVTATILDLMGLSVPRHVEGESLRPLLRRGHSATDRRIFSELRARRDHPQPGTYVSLLERDRKLIVRIEDGQRWLYNVSRDPDEQTNLAAQQPDLAASMERTIRQFLKMRKDVRAPDRPMTPAEERRLRALGYLDPGGR